MLRNILKKRVCKYFLFFMVFSMTFPAYIFALPQGGNVVSGQAGISTPDPGNMHINQGTNKAIINWQSFSIAHPEAVRFFQPGSSSIALNRVIGVDPSAIYGSLTANGRIFLINTNGILVGPTGRINVNSFLASTLDMANEDFLSGSYIFSQTLGKSLSSIVNQGIITTAPGGFTSLLAPAVQNEGSIIASLGKVYIGAGEQVTLNFLGDDLINFVVDKDVTDKVLGPDGEPLDDTILNKGSISAEGGEVILSAKTAYDAIKSVINNEGIIEAKSIVNENGVIKLVGGDKGIVKSSGTLNASGKEEGQTGGTVQVLGEYVGLFDTANIDVSGDLGGGTVLIGGDFQGKNPDIMNASRTYVGSDVSITADALTNGDGGEVIVWADDVTRFYGDISARGGDQGGDGGFVEVSGKELLKFQPEAIDLSAAAGLGGTLLLDPASIELTNTDAFTTGFTVPGDLTEAFSDDAAAATTFDVTASGSFDGIANGSTIVLQADNSITVSTAFDIATATGNTGFGTNLTLQAGGNIIVNQAITTYGGTLDFTANDVGGTQSGTGYIDLNAALDTTGGAQTGGAVTLTVSGGTGNIQLGDNITTSTANITFAGPVTLTAASVLSTTAGVAGTITFQSTLDGTTDFIETLGLTAGTGNIDFDDIVGGTKDLGDVTINSAAAVTADAAFNADSITQSAGTGTTTFTGAVATNGTGTGGDGVNITTSGVGGIVFSSTLNTNGNSVVLKGDEMTLPGTLTATGSTVELVTNSAIAINIDNGTAGLNLTDVALDGIAANSITIGDGTSTVLTVGGAVSQNQDLILVSGTTMAINSTIDTTAGAGTGLLTLTNGGVLTIAAAGNITTTGAFTQDGAGLVSTAGDITTTNDDINFLRAVTLTAGPVALDTGAGAGTITFQAALDGTADHAEDITLTAGTGSIDFDAAVGATKDLGVVTIVSALDVTADLAFNAEQVDQTAGTGTTTFTGAVQTLGTLATDGLDLNGTAFTFSNTVNTGAAGAVTITNSGLLTIAAAADMTLGGAFTQDGAGLVSTAGDITTTNDDINFLRAVTLTAGPVALDTGAGAGTITFQAALDGTADFIETLGLTAGTGNIDFDDIVGGTKDLGDVTINSAAAVTADAAFNADSITQSAGTGTTTFTGAVATNGTGTGGDGVNITTSGVGGIVFSSTLNTNGNSVVLKGDEMTLPGTLTATGSTVELVTNSAIAINIDNGTAGLNLTDVALDGIAANSITIGDGTSTVLTVGGAVSQNQDLILVSGTTMAINSTIDTTAGAGTGLLTLTNGGVLTIAAAGNITTTGAFTQDGAGLVSTAGDITTTNDDINFLRAVTLTAGPVALDTGAGAGTITFQAALDGTADHAEDITLTAGTGSIDFDAAVGATKDLGVVTIVSALDVTADLAFNAEQVDQTAGTGTTTFTGAVQTLGTLATDGLDLNGTAFTFSNTVNTGAAGAVTITNSGLLTIAAAADMTLGGAFTQDGAGLVSTAGDITTTNDDINFLRAVTLTAGPVALDTGAGAGTITFQAALDGTADHAEDITLTAGTGSIDFDAAVGATKDLGVVTIVSALDVTADLAFNAEQVDQTAGTGTTTFTGAVQTLGTLATDGLDLNGTAFTFSNTVNTGAAGAVTITNSGLLTIAAAADMTLGGAFTQDGAGLVSTAGDITTTNDDINFLRAVTLTAGPVALDTGAGAGTITFQAALDGTADHAEDITLTAGTGSIDFDAAVGATKDLGVVTIVSALDVTADLAFNAEQVDQTAGTGTTTFTGAVQTLGTLATDGLDLNGTAFTFSNTVNTGAAGAVTITNSGLLTIAAAADMTLGGAFTQDGAGLVSTAGDITTTNDDINFLRAVTLTAGPVALDTGAGAGTITFQAALDGTADHAEDITLTAGTGSIDFDAAVGATKDLGVVTIVSALDVTADLAFNAEQVDQTAGTGTTTFTGAVQTLGTLATDGLDLNGTAFTFSNTVNTGAAGAVTITNSGLLTIAAAADMTLGGAFTQDGAGLVSTAGDITTTNDDINFLRAVTLTAGPVALDTGAGAGTITFQAALDGTADHAEDITLTAGTGSIDFDAAVGATKDLGVVTIVSALDVTADLAFNAEQVDQTAGTGTTTFTGAVQTLGTLATDGLDLNGTAFTFSNTVNTGAAGAVTITNSGLLTIAAAADMTLGGAFTQDGAGLVSTAGDITTTNDDINFLRAVTLTAGPVALDTGAGAGTITFQAALDGTADHAEDITLTAGTGSIDFDAAVGATKDLGVVTIVSALDVTADLAFNAEQVDQTAGTGTTTFTGAVQTLGTLATDGLDLNGTAFTFSNTVNTGAAGAVTITNSGLLTIAAAADMTLGGAFTQDGAGLVSTAGDITTTNDDINFLRAVTLTAGPVALDTGAGAGTITFQAALDGTADHAEDITLTAGTGSIDFDAAVGATKDLGVVTIVSALDVTADLAFNAEQVDQTAGTGTTTFTGAVQTLGTLATDGLDLNGTAFTFSNTVNTGAAGAVTITNSGLLTIAAAADMTLGGAFTQDGAGLVSTAGDITTTNDDINFLRAVTLTAGPVALDTGAGAGTITFQAALDGTADHAEDITLTAGTGSIDFDAAVGATKDLGVVTIVSALDVTADLAFNAEQVDQTAGTGTTTFTGAVQTLGTLATDGLDLNGTAFTFSNTVNTGAAGAVTITNSGLLTIAAAADMTLGGAFTQDGAGLVSTAGDITTTNDDINFLRAVTLTAGPVALDTGAGAGTITFQAALDGTADHAEDITLTAGTGSIDFDAAVGATKDLGVVTIVSALDVTADLAFNAEQVDQTAGTGTTTFTGAVQTLGTLATDGLDLNGTAFTFSNTVNTGAAGAVTITNSGLLTIAAAADMTLGGAFTQDGAGLVSTAGDITTTNDDINFLRAVTLTAGPVALDTGAGAGTITFQAALDGTADHAEDITLTAGTGSIDFDAAVGATKDLGVVTIVSALDVTADLAFNAEQVDQTAGTGTTTFTGAVQTLGTLATDGLDLNGTAFTFSNTVNTGAAGAVTITNSGLLTIAAAADMTLGGAFTQDGAGLVSTAGDITTTNDDINFLRAVTLTAGPVALDTGAGAGTITFQAALDGTADHAEDITLTAGTGSIDFDAAVGATKDLGVVTIVSALDVTADLAFNAEQVDQTAGTGTTTFTGAVQTLGTLATDGLDLNGTAFTFSNTVNTGAAGAVTITNSGLLTIAAAADMTLGGAFTQDGAGLVSTAGDITTTNDDINFLRAVTLTAGPVALDTGAGAGTITFQAALDGTADHAEDITLTAGTGSIDFDAAVGATKDLGVVTIVSALDVTADLAFNAEQVDQTAGTGTTTFTGAVQTLGTLATDGLDLNGTAFTFSNTVNTGAAGAVTITNSGLLTIAAAADMTLGGAFTQDGAGLVSTAGDITTTNDDINFLRAVTLTAGPVALDTGAGAGTITFQAALDGTADHAEDITLTAGTGSIDFDAAVGATKDLGVVTIVSALDVTADLAFNAEQVDQTAGTGTTTFTGAVQTLGTLATDGLDLNGTAFTFSNTVNTGAAGAVTITNSGLLTIAAAADMTLGGAFTQDGAGLVSTAGDITTTNDDINFLRAVTLTAGPVALDTGAGAGTITFQAALDGTADHAEDITLTAGTGSIDFDAAVGATKDLGVVTIVSALDVTADLAFNAEQVDQTAGTGTTTFTGAVQTLGTLATDGLDLNGTAFTFSNTVNTGAAGAVTITNSGLLTIAAAADMTLGGAFTQDGAGLVSTAGDITTTNDDINFLRAVTLTAGPVALDTGAGAGTITFQAALDGTADHAEDITLTAGTGSIDFDAAVGATKDLGVVTIVSALDVTADLAFNAEQVDQTAGTGTTTFTGAVQTLGTLATDGLDLNGTAFTFSNTVNTGAAGAVTITNSGLLTIAAAADMTLGGAFTQDGAGLVSTAGDITTTNDDINFLRAVTLTAGPVALDTGAGAGTITFQAALDGTADHAEDITLTAGTGSIDFDAAVGATKDLGVVTIVSALDVTADLAFNAEQVDQTAGTGTTTFTGAVQTLGTLATDGLDLNGTAFTFSNTVNTGAAGAVTITNSGLLTIAAAADMTLGGAFTQDGAGLVSTAGDITTTNDDINFLRAVTLTAGPVALDTGAGAGTITFQAALDGTADHAEDITLTAGTGSIDFDAAVGATKDLGVVTIVSALDVTADLAFNAEQVDQTAGTGTTTFTGAVQTLGTLATDGLDLNGTAFTFSNTVNTGAAGAVTITNSGLLTIAAAADMTLGGAFTQDGAGLVSTAGDITTTNDDINFLRAVTLTAGPVALDTGAGAGNILFSSTVDGRHDLTLAAGTGTITFSAEVGSGVDTEIGDGDGAAIIINSGVTTFENTLKTISGITSAANVTFKGNVTIAGAGTATTLDADVTLDGLIFSSVGAVTFGLAATDQVTLSTSDVTIQTTGALTVNAEVDGPLDLTLDTTGAATFNAAVGSSNAIGDGTDASLIINSTGATTFVSTLKTTDGITQANGAGDVKFQENVTIEAGTTASELIANVILDGLTFSSAGAVTFGNDTAADQVTLSTGDVTIRTTGAGDTLTVNAKVDGDKDLTLDTFDTATFNGAVGSGTPIGDGTGAALTINSTGATTFANALGTASGITQAGGAGLVKFQEDVTIGTDDTASTFNANVTLDGLTFTSAGDVTFGDAADDQITLSGGDVTVTTATANANQTYEALVDGDYKLTLAAGTGDIEFDSTVGAAAPLSGLQVVSAANLYFENTVAVDDEGIDITAGTVNIDNKVTTTGTGMVEITNSGLLTILGDGDMTLDGAFTQNGTGAVSTAGDITTTADKVSFAKGVTLTGAVALSTGAGAGNILFSNTLDGGQDLTLTAGTGTITFNEAVGTTAIGDGTGAAITINSGAATFEKTLATASGITSDANVTFKGNVTIAAGDTATTLNEDVTLDGLTFTSAGDVTFGDAADDQITLSTAAVTVTTSAANKNQTYKGLVDGGQDLTLAAGTGTITFDAAVGGSTAISSIDIDATTLTQNAAITAAGLTDINTTNALTVAHNITSTGGAIVLTAPGIVLDADISAGTTLKLDAGSDEDDANNSNITGTGQFTSGGETNIYASLIGHSSDYSLSPMANVVGDNLYMTLTGGKGGVSGRLRAGAKMSSAPPKTNFVSEGYIYIKGFPMYSPREGVDIEAILAAIATLSSQQEKMEAMLFSAAAGAGEFFMQEPVWLDFGLEMIYEGLENVPVDQWDEMMRLWEEKYEEWKKRSMNETLIELKITRESVSQPSLAKRFTSSVIYENLEDLSVMQWDEMMCNYLSAN